jgi:hypothetical protein
MMRNFLSDTCSPAMLTDSPGILVCGSIPEMASPHMHPQMVAAKGYA